MCGFIGIIKLNGKDVAEELVTGLLSIQHRGQDSSGIITSDRSRFHIKKNAGLVSNVFSKSDVKSLKGNVGIGHVRYSTIGFDIENDSQPFFVNYPFGIALAHNGNIANYEEIRSSLEKESHRQLTSRCDAELILNVFADEMSRTSGDFSIGKVFDSLGPLMKKLNGSYSAVAIINGHGLLAFRDPNGLRPMIFGKNDSGFIFASETVVLNLLDYTYIRDVKPGEAIFIDNNGKIHSKIIDAREKTPCMFEWVYFARPDSTIEGRSVYDVRLRLGEELAKRWDKDVDVVIPVPDTSRTAAMGFAKAIGAEYREGLIKNRYVGRTFIMPAQKKRDNAVKLKLNPITSEIKGKKIALVDDSIVRGTTSKRLVSLLRKYGAKEIHLVVTCPPIKYPCFYGIDIATRKELIASDKSVEEIRKFLGADSITYQTIEGLKRAIGMNSICTACLTGNYPTNISETDISRFEKIREEERSRVV
ncbi:MAG: amidophosphoribosyltransferase [Candidatus Aenigmarchaeota archaeon]|nr:amidophosphoribosyltransferase [Candidatus Aenigmarchaeota archaeon]